VTRARRSGFAERRLSSGSGSGAQAQRQFQVEFGVPRSGRSSARCDTLLGQIEQRQWRRVGAAFAHLSASSGTDCPGRTEHLAQLAARGIGGASSSAAACRHHTALNDGRAAATHSRDRLRRMPSCAAVPGDGPAAAASCRFTSCARASCRAFERQSAGHAALARSSRSGARPSRALHGPLPWPHHPQVGENHHGSRDQRERERPAPQSAPPAACAAAAARAPPPQIDDRPLQSVGILGLVHAIPGSSGCGSTDSARAPGSRRRRESLRPEPTARAEAGAMYSRTCDPAPQIASALRSG